MPADDVSDLRDVVDAINRLCDTMKTSQYDDVADDPIETEDESEVTFRPIVTEFPYVRDVRSAREVSASPEVADPVIEMSDLAAEILECLDVASPEEVSIQTIEIQERWSDSMMSLPVETVASDTEPAAQCEPASEMYYTASSEVSLLSDTEAPERAADDDSLEGRRDERKEVVIAGHVAAMRERFESMTRTNTPCPDLVRSSSPSLDVFRNITPSPDRLG